MKCNAKVVYYKVPKKNGQKRVFCTFPVEYSIVDVDSWIKTSKRNISNIDMASDRLDIAIHVFREIK